MIPRRVLTSLLAAAALAVPASALAGHPAPGAKYRGRSDPGDRIVLRVNKSAHHMYVKVVDPCGITLTGSGLTIGGQGHFDAVSSTGAEVKGHFLSRRKAVGTIDNDCKQLGSREFVAARL